MDFTPIDFDKTYPLDYKSLYPTRPTKLEEYFNDLYERCAKMYDWSDNGKQISYQEAKMKLNSLYGTLAMREKENKMKDYIVVHSDNGIGIVLKKAIVAIQKRRTSTVIFFNGEAIYCDDKYEDIIKQYLDTK